MADPEETGKEGGTPPGWYPDPWGGGGQRWWDGNEWTGHVFGGAPAGGGPSGSGQGQHPKTSGFAIASLVFGVIGGSILAIVFGLIARNRIDKSGGTLGGRGLATAGIVLGALWLGLILLFVALSATGVIDESTNAEKYRGEERRVAQVVDRFEAYSDEERFSAICNDLFTPEWKDAVARGGGGSCEGVFDDEVGGKVQAEIDIEDISITGSRAEVAADEAGEELDISLIREDGTWKISAFR